MTNVKATHRSAPSRVSFMTSSPKSAGVLRYGLFTLADPDSDPYSDFDSCTMQKFHIGSDSDSDPLIEIYVVGTEICP